MPELIHTLRLPVPVDRAWAALDDPDLVASVFPGAAVSDRGSDDVSGELSVKVGPVRARYAGAVRVTWRDRPARRFVLEATGDEVDGLGTLQATIHVTLNEADDGAATDVELRTNLAVTGRVAQFGDAVLDDVLGRHLQGLASGLEAAGFPEAAPARPARRAGVAEEPPGPEPSAGGRPSSCRPPPQDLEEAGSGRAARAAGRGPPPGAPASSLPPPPPPPPPPSLRPDTGPPAPPVVRPGPATSGPAARRRRRS